MRILAVLLLMTLPATADIEAARDLMEANKFEEAREALWPAARSGNADAEELIDYEEGIGTAVDLTRAYMWYALKSFTPGSHGSLRRALPAAGKA